MKRLTINPSNKPYYSEDFIKGFEYGTQRQLEADLADRPQGEWIYNGNFCGMNHHKCSVCGRTEFRMSAYCPNCGAKMDLLN